MTRAGGPASDRHLNWVRDCVDFLFPPICSLCQVEIESPQLLCDSCRQLVVGKKMDICRRCCAPVGPHLDTTAGCVHCRKDPFPFERVLALGAYDGPLRNACLRMKHDSTDRVARALTGLLLDRWGEEMRSWNVDVIVPVPAHWTTRIGRAPRPANAIAERVASFLMAPCDLHILRKSRRTPSQSSLSPTRRRENLRGAFRRVAGVNLSGSRVLLVDDVLTTGTTAARSARVLKEAGAETVHVAVIARGIGR